MLNKKKYQSYCLAISNVCEHFAHRQPDVFAARVNHLILGIIFIWFTWYCCGGHERKSLKLEAAPVNYGESLSLLILLFTSPECHRITCPQRRGVSQWAACKRLSGSLWKPGDWTDGGINAGTDKANGEKRSVLLWRPFWFGPFGV